MFAQQEAKRMKSAELEPVHLLLGVLSNPEGCYRGIQRCNLKVPEVTRAVETYLTTKDGAADGGPDRSPLVGMFLESKGAPTAKASLPKGSKDAPFSKAVQKSFPLAMQVGFDAVAYTFAAQFYLLSLSLIKIHLWLFHLINGFRLACMCSFISYTLQVSDAMTSEVVRSEHVLWALMEDETVVEALNLVNDDTAAALKAELDIDLESGRGKAELVGGAPKSETPTLAQCGVDLTELAKTGKLDPVAGRSEEVNRAMQVLVRRRKSNPCFIGDPGVGKTAIAEGIAQRIASKDCPKRLRDCRIISLELSNLVAGTRWV